MVKVWLLYINLLTVDSKFFRFHWNYYFFGQVVVFGQPRAKASSTVVPSCGIFTSKPVFHLFPKL